MIRIGISHAAGPTEKNLELRGHVKALVVISFVGMLFVLQFSCGRCYGIGFPVYYLCGYPCTAC